MRSAVMVKRVIELQATAELYALSARVAYDLAVDHERDIPALRIQAVAAMYAHLARSAYAFYVSQKEHREP